MRQLAAAHPTFGNGLYARMLAGEPGLAPAVLRAVTSLASVAFGAGVSLRRRLYDADIPPFVAQTPPIPVVSVGNLSVGGTGKSMVATYIAQRAIACGVRPVIVARGYGGAPEAGGLLGDEALEQRQQLRETVPVICNPNRLVAVRQAALAGAELAILDDGFQHRRLARALDIVCVDLLAAPGTFHLLPRGLLREPLSALRRAHVVLLTRADLAPATAAADLESRMRQAGFAGLCLRAAHRPTELVSLDEVTSRSPDSCSGERVLLVSGLGNPMGFAATVRALGAEVVGHVALPDHHRYGFRDVEEVRRMAATVAATRVITTGKDAVKLAPLASAEGWWVLRVELEILAEASRLDEELRAAHARARDSH